MEARLKFLETRNTALSEVLDDVTDQANGLLEVLARLGFDPNGNPLPKEAPETAGEAAIDPPPVSSPSPIADEPSSPHSGPDGTTPPLSPDWFDSAKAPEDR